MNAWTTGPSAVLRQIADMASARNMVRMPSGTSLELTARSGQRQAEALEALVADMAEVLRQCEGALWLTGDRFNDHRAALTDAIRALLAKLERGAK